MVDGPALVFIPMELKPPIACRTTDELLRITADPTNWTPEARALARIEHEHRAIPASAIAARELAYAEKERGQAELLARNASESYSAWQIIGLFLVAPILIIGKLLGNHFALDIKLDRTELDRENYKRKYRQRMGALIAGNLFWIVLATALS